MNVKELPADRVLDRLITGLQESERRFFHASEHIRNRGLKLVLKTYVQQRAQFARELVELSRPAGYQPPDDAPGPSFGQGLSDIQTTMIVRREDRQEHVLTQVADADEALVNLYDQVLQEGLPASVAALVQQQASAIRRIQRRLRLLAESGNRRLLVRLFDDGDKAQAVMEQLAAAGFDEDALYTAAVDELPVYTKGPVTRRRSMRETVLTSTGLGVLVGLILGGILAFGHRLYFPEVPGLFTNTPWGVTLELLSAGALIGALFGTIFGLFIGRDAAEDDAYLYEASLQQGDTLVAVITDRHNAAVAEEIVGLRHEFEVEPAV
jgi:DNA-binding FrmR family transcriptional regulator